MSTPAVTDSVRYEIRNAAGVLGHSTADEQQAKAVYAQLSAHQAVALYRVERLRESPAHAAERGRPAKLFSAPQGAVG